jgi:hypothetical protein
MLPTAGLTKPQAAAPSASLRALAWEWAPLFIAVCFVLTFLAFFFSVPSQQLPSAGTAPLPLALCYARWQ